MLLLNPSHPNYPHYYVKHIRMRGSSGSLCPFLNSKPSLTYPFSTSRVYIFIALLVFPLSSSPVYMEWMMHTFCWARLYRAWLSNTWPCWLIRLHTCFPLSCYTLSTKREDMKYHFLKSVIVPNAYSVKFKKLYSFGWS